MNHTTFRIEGVVIDVRHHNDRHNIITLYTRSHGRLACISATGNSKGARMRTSMLQPLAVIASDIRFNSNRELQTLGGFDMLLVTHNIFFDPAKRALSFFIAEFLNRLLRESAPDANIFQTIIQGIESLENSSDNIADFHIAFLSMLLRPIGIYPDFSNYHPLYYFDMNQGGFFMNRPMHNNFLTGEDAEIMTYIRQISFSNHHNLSITPQIRQRLLDLLLRYYSTHFPGMSSLKSLNILRDLF